MRKFWIDNYQAKCRDFAKTLRECRDSCVRWNPKRGAYLSFQANSDLVVLHPSELDTNKPLNELCSIVERSLFTRNFFPEEKEHA